MIICKGTSQMIINARQAFINAPRLARLHNYGREDAAAAPGVGWGIVEDRI